MMSNHNPEPLNQSLRGLMRRICELAQIRLELLSIEAHEIVMMIVSMMTYGALALFFLCFGLGFFAILITVLFWDSNRVLVLGILTGLFLSLGVAFTFITLVYLKKNRYWFASSRAELKQDAEKLEQP